MELRQRQLPTGIVMDSDPDPVLARVYAARGVDARNSSLELADLIDPAELAHIEEACDLLEAQLHNGGKVLVVGDFDADGATSSALALLSLRAMGFANVDYLVPNRFEYGYGLTPEIAQVVCAARPELLITVDNGISSHEGVRICRDAGIRVLITDHHLPGNSLPDADCILNPNLNSCSFPDKGLAGVGVVFYLMLAMRARLRDTGWFALEGLPEPKLARYLDIVALGTVADVVPLGRNNRILVRHGLRLIRSGHARPGIRALLDIAGRDLSVLSAADLGFAAGPRLNAAGRLDDMSLGIECLLCDDPLQAREIAAKLDSLNRERREIELDMQEAALAHLNTLEQADESEAGLCLYRADWHQGVIGILASRLKDRFHSPTVVFADAGEGMIKGSARSISGLHMRDLLESIDTANPGLISGFGGHAMAAGLSLPKGHFDDFKHCYHSRLSSLLDDSLRARILWTDGELPDSHLNIEFAEYLQNAGPWGQHFPEPVFEGTFTVSARRVMAGKHLKLQLALTGSRASMEAVAFNAPQAWLTSEATELRLAYRLGLNAWAGRVKPQLIVEHLAAS